MMDTKVMDISDAKMCHLPVIAKTYERHIEARAGHVLWVENLPSYLQGKEGRKGYRVSRLDRLVEPINCYNYKEGLKGFALKELDQLLTYLTLEIGIAAYTLRVNPLTLKVAFV
jgi:hypothetical protein